MSWIVEGGRALIGGEILPAEVFVEEDRIAEAPAREAARFDAGGLLVLPGIVDVHGDGFERQIMPRPRAHFPLDVALRDTDHQMIVNGITTAFHGLTVSWEPGLRSLETARGFVEALDRLRLTLACDNRLHLRWETFALDAVEEVLAWLALEPRPILAFNDHTTKTAEHGARARKLDDLAERAGLTPEDYKALLAEAWARRDEVPDAIARLAGHARGLGAVLLAHDEESPEERARFRALGAVASEFPLNEATARAAREAGEHTIMGAPNVVRGGSHLGAVNAAEAVSAGLCSVLATDYYYPAPLLAAFRLAAEGRKTLPEAWDLVSKNAAEAAGLDDRGTLDPGSRADLILVDDSDPLSPRVVACIVAGKKVLARH